MSLEFKSDLHTHTFFSHGKGTIEENILAAIEIGLTQIGISDHGPGHFGFGVTRKKMAEMKAEIIGLRRKYQEIEILFGIEANIIVPSGRLDISQEEVDYFDFVCAGWHYGAFDGMTPAGVGRTIGNYASSMTSKSTRRQIRRNTDAIVKCLYAYNIMFLTHPSNSAPIDLLEVAVACAKTNTYLEINTSHMSLSAEDIKMITSLTDAKFIVNSDAHTTGRIGDFEPAVDLIKKSELDPKRIVNLREI